MKSDDTFFSIINYVSDSPRFMFECNNNLKII